MRIKRVCSQESDFNEHSLNLKSWFLKRGYLENIVNTEMSKFKFNVDNKNSDNRYIINKHLYLLYINDEVKVVFTPKPMVSFRSSHKISSYLVRAKLYSIERTVGSFRCGRKHCDVCKYITD